MVDMLLAQSLSKLDTPFEIHLDFMSYLKLSVFNIPYEFYPSFYLSSALYGKADYTQFSKVTIHYESEVHSEYILGTLYHQTITKILLGIWRISLSCTLDLK